MLSEEELKTIEELVKEFFRKANLEAQVSVGKVEDLTVPVSLNMDSPQILIGEGGQTLAEIQHLLKKVLKKKIASHFYIDLDINDYKKKKFEYLKDLARETADEVALYKKIKEFPPMPSYERRIIHLELASRQDVASESVGQGRERRVVVRPYP